MKSLTLVCLVLFAGCAKVRYTSAPVRMPIAVNDVLPAAPDELAELTAERDRLTANLRADYQIDVAQPRSRWSCCGVVWQRYSAPNLDQIRTTFDRILAISRRRAELTATDEWLDPVAVRTSTLRRELGYHLEARR